MYLYMPSPPASPPAHLVDVGQRALTGELHCIDLHSRACLNDLILIAQGGHIEHEGLSSTNELVVHLGQKRPAKQKQDKLLSCYLLPWAGVSYYVSYSESPGQSATSQQQHTHILIQDQW